MPYVTRNEAGEIVCLYEALAPEFQQARNYLSTDKLQERLDEYGAVHAEAERLGVSFDEAVADICARWPEWIPDADFGSANEAVGADPDAQPEASDGEGGTSDEFESDHGPDLAQPEPESISDIREAYEASFDDGAGEVGSDLTADIDSGGDAGEPAAASEDAGPDLSADFSAEPVGDDSALAEPNSYPGLMIDHQHTETLLYNLREGPIKLVRDFYESRLMHELGDQDMRNALAFSDDPYREEKLGWITAMDAVLEQKLAEIAEMDGRALANYRGEAEGWPPVPVEEVEYEDDETEDEA